MSSKTSFTQLAPYLDERVTDSRCQKALRGIENDAEMRARLADQVAFDRQMVEMVGAIRAPSDLRARLEKNQQLTKEKRSRETLVAIMAVVMGVGLIAGLLIYFQVQSSRAFPGRETLERIAASANRMSGVELEPVSQQAGQLSDWFYMRGFESFALPQELRNVPAVGSRLFRVDGYPVAQVAIDLHESLLYVFNGKDFGVQLPPSGDWRTFDVEGWAAAARQGDGACYMITFRGTESEMKDFLATLRKP